MRNRKPINKTFSENPIPKYVKDLDLEAYMLDKDDDLIEAVNLAAFLSRPLFLTGDPGCGKTRLAEAIAYQWYGKNFKKFYFRWDIKSTSKAKEGLYTFDNLKRLYDVQKSAHQHHLPDEETVDTKNLKQYRKFGKLGDAFRKSTEENPAILLIDEIDKAPIDFPNDLLLELDEMKFHIQETNETIAAKQPPLVIITSNSEKEMPAAFLRRCVYCHIQFPENEKLKVILKAQDDIDEDLIDKGIDVFRALRTKQEQENKMGNKLASTSEMIDWFRYLSKIAGTGKKESILEKLKAGEIPSYQALFKKLDDIHLFPDNKVELPENEEN